MLYSDSLAGSFKQFEADTDAYFETLEKYKHLQTDWVPEIPDNELEDAVMSWMWNKFNEDWSNQYEVISTLPKSCQNVFSCRTIIDEVNNGGFNQLFFNSSRQFAIMSIDGFLALGSPQLSSIMEESVVLYWHNKETLDAYDDGTLESFSASYKEKIFDNLDERFYPACESLDYIKYIRLHTAFFGD